MKYKVFCLLMVFMCSTFFTLTGQSLDNEQDVIIIEKTVDENGKVISKKIKRSSRGDLSDKELEKELENIQGFSLDNFMDGLDLNELDFNFGGMNKPTLGLVIEDSKDNLKVAEVVKGSGAEKSGVKVGDVVLTVEGMTVNSVEEMNSLIADKTVGDEIDLQILRNGKKRHINVELRNNLFSQFGDIFSEDFLNNFNGFGEQFGEMFKNFNFDSLFNSAEFPNMGEWNRMMPNYSDKMVEEDRPSLGVFVEETSGGILITDVIDDTPAAEANLKSGDVIISIEGNKVKSIQQLTKYINGAGNDTNLLLEINRKGKKKEIEVQF